ncbi:hypothetical protein FGB62_85g00 [Gracilaria domingensis]|nr:hypothetical protein FGB62_85g00 [Gracilaria domingensis]
MQTAAGPLAEGKVLGINGGRSKLVPRPERRADGCGSRSLLLSLDPASRSPGLRGYVHGTRALLLDGDRNPKTVCADICRERNANHEDVESCSLGCGHTDLGIQPGNTGTATGVRHHSRTNPLHERQSAERVQVNEKYTEPTKPAESKPSTRSTGPFQREWKGATAPVTVRQNRNTYTMSPASLKKRRTSAPTLFLLPLILDHPPELSSKANAAILSLNHMFSVAGHKKREPREAMLVNNQTSPAYISASQSLCQRSIIERI